MLLGTLGCLAMIITSLIPSAVGQLGQPQMVMKCTEPFGPIYRTCPGVGGAPDQYISAQTCGTLCSCKSALGKPSDIDCVKEGVLGTECSGLDLVRTCKCGVARDAYDLAPCPGQPCWCEASPP